MTDGWDDEVEQPRKKGGLPGWFWWTCGVGCLVTVVLSVVIGILAVGVGKKFMDPEEAKKKLVLVLPCDEWPEDYEPRGGGWGIEEYAVIYPGGMAMVIRTPGRGDLREMLDPDSAANFLNNSFETGEIEIQGRETTYLRFEDFMDMKHLRVDISGEKAPNALVEILEEGDEPIELDAVKRFLEPFDIWRGED
jgi:hypothetical protein